MISFLRDYGLLNLGDLIIVFLYLITFGFFLVRTGIYFHFKWFGVPYRAKIVSSEKVAVLKNRSVYGVYNDAYQYTYEYKNQQGTTHQGTVKKLFLSAAYQVGDEIEVQYLKNNPKRVRIYSRRDWFRFEFMLLIISLVLFLILLVKALI